MCSPRSFCDSWRWKPPKPLAPRRDKPTMLSPKNVTVRATPAPMVRAINASPTAARADPVRRKQSSAQVRRVNGVRMTLRTIALNLASNSSETTIIILLTRTSVAVPVSLALQTDRSSRQSGTNTPKVKIPRRYEKRASGTLWSGG